MGKLLKYSQEIHDEALLRYNSGEGPLKIVHELGLKSVATLYYWIKRTKVDLNAHLQRKELHTAHSTKAFYKVVESATMNTQERKDFCLQNGINPDDLENWRTKCMKANEPSNLEHLQKENAELREKLKQTEKELKAAKSNEKQLEQYKSAATDMAVLFDVLKNACWAEGIDVDLIVNKK